MPAPELPTDLILALSRLDDPRAIRKLLADLLTPYEVEELNGRWAIARLLAEGVSQRAIAEQVGVSITTVSRGSRALKYGEGGFALAFEALVGELEAG